MDELVGWLEILPRQEELSRTGHADGVEHAGMSAYAEEVRLASRARGAWARLPMGDVLLKLKGRASIKWLLYVEMAQSAGMRDPWRLSREGLIEALRLKSFEGPHWAFKRWPMPAEHEVMWRWMSIGIWRYENDREGLLFELGDRNPLLEEALSDLPEPLASFARAMSRDQEGEDLGEIHELLYAPATARSALEEFARNTKHELANRLLPVQGVIGELVDELRLVNAPEERVTYLAGRAEEKVDYLFRFARGIVQMAEMVPEPQLDFELASVVGEAIQATRVERNGRVNVQLVGPVHDYVLRGPRQLVVNAFINLIRNSAQARPTGAVRVNVNALRQGPEILIHYDDDGPGVPLEYRQRVFVDGFSLRGGSGLGLALVERAVVAMGGTATCEESPLGGARFTLRIPLQPPGGQNMERG